MSRELKQFSWNCRDLNYLQIEVEDSVGCVNFVGLNRM